MHRQSNHVYHPSGEGGKCQVIQHSIIDAEPGRAVTFLGQAQQEKTMLTRLLDNLE
jgi:hypothetical protein